ncbi:hypothetical protein P154DRAFT_19250 [Amniculicola lignicola CBS 123094]|uniref:Uncharacterized protein n=1 Tax=Amniculicola lignicola CBS 123094 TaxID=1392246 RepID=A0A6A5X0B8_9PLEO|nr:hypothetical protein P154DRAFT_19250 [Amniculicola lignicola CBS 123094]
MVCVECKLSVCWESCVSDPGCHFTKGRGRASRERHSSPNVTAGRVDWRPRRAWGWSQGGMKYGLCAGRASSLRTCMCWCWGGCLCLCSVPACRVEQHDSILLVGKLSTGSGAGERERCGWASRGAVGRPVDCVLVGSPRFASALAFT